MSSDVYYRIFDTGDGMKLITLQDFDESDYNPSKYVLPVKFYDKKYAKQIMRKITYGLNDEEYLRGVLDGITIADRDDVVIDYGSE